MEEKVNYLLGVGRGMVEDGCCCCGGRGPFVGRKPGRLQLKRITATVGPAGRAFVAAARI